MSWVRRPRLEVEPGTEQAWAGHDRLEQVFVNRLGNAARHGAAARRTDVAVHPAAAPRWAEVKVTDYGPGIPAGLTERILVPRVRGTTEVAGTGRSCRGILERGGGPEEIRGG